MPVTGVKKVRANMRKVFKDISEKKAVKFIQAVISIGASQAREFTAVEYSNLVNSVTMWTEKKGSTIVGDVTYNANYAAYLEFNVDWKPRPVSMKNGPAANMDAGPHFLKRGFESKESRDTINKVMKIMKV